MKIASKPVAALPVICLATLPDVGASHANGGAVAAGMLGGFAAGAILGSAVAARPC